MKRILTILLVSVLAIALVACQGTPAASQSASQASDAPASAAQESAMGGDDQIKIGHLSYHTGPFGHLGEMFDSSVAFTIGFVNENPPLGREVIALNEDIGTLGEGQVARKLVENDKVQILYNVAGEYMSYRDWLVQFEKDNNGPLLPSIHAGAVDASIGGVAGEPIFRGSPMDTDQALAAALELQKSGAKSVVCIAVENDGMQMQQDAAAAACTALGIEVLGSIDIQPEQTSYRSEASKAQSLNPEAMIIYGAAEDAGTFVKNCAEMGMSTMIVGETNFMFDEFLNTATLDAIQAQKFVKCVGFTYSEGPAWDFYKAAWDSSEYKDVEDPANSYVLAAYDVLNMTMLAIQKAGSTDADAWTAAMYKVSMAPGTKVYTYAEGMEALAKGEDIDYEGVTGSCDYTQTGVISGLYQIYDWSTGELLKDKLIQGTEILDLAQKIQ